MQEKIKIAIENGDVKEASRLAIDDREVRILSKHLPNDTTVELTPLHYAIVYYHQLPSKEKYPILEMCEALRWYMFAQEHIVSAECMISFEPLAIDNKRGRSSEELTKLYDKKRVRDYLGNLFSRDAFLEMVLRGQSHPVSAARIGFNDLNMLPSEYTPLDYAIHYDLAEVVWLFLQYDQVKEEIGRYLDRALYLNANRVARVMFEVIRDEGLDVEPSMFSALYRGDAKGVKLCHEFGCKVVHIDDFKLALASNSVECWATVLDLYIGTVNKEMVIALCDQVLIHLIPIEHSAALIASIKSDNPAFDRFKEIFRERYNIVNQTSYIQYAIDNNDEKLLRSLNNLLSLSAPYAFIIEGVRYVYTPLTYAASIQSPMLHVLLELEVAVNSLVYDASVLHYLAKTWFDEAVWQKLNPDQFKEVINRSSKKGSTALSVAISVGNVPAVLWLLAAGAELGNINIHNEVLKASSGGSPRILEALVSTGAGKKVIDKFSNGKNALLTAIEKGLVVHVSVLIKAGAKVAVRGLGNVTALMYASEIGSQMIRAVLKGVRKINRVAETINAVKDDNFVSKDGCLTALQIAVSKNFVISDLLDCRADPNQTNRDGLNALQIAIQSGASVATVIKLMDAGCNPFARNEKGKSAADMAMDVYTNADCDDVYTQATCKDESSTQYIQAINQWCLERIQ